MPGSTRDEHRRASSPPATCRTTSTGRPSPRPAPAVWRALDAERFLAARAPSRRDCAGRERANAVSASSAGPPGRSRLRSTACRTSSARTARTARSTTTGARASPTSRRRATAAASASCSSCSTTTTRRRRRAWSSATRSGRILATGRGVFELTGFQESELMGRDVVEALTTAPNGRTRSRSSLEWGVRQLGEQLSIRTRAGHREAGRRRHLPGVRRRRRPARRAHARPTEPTRARLRRADRLADSTQPSQRGRRASQTRRPCQISRCGKRAQSARGTSLIRSRSIFTGSSWRVSPSRCDSRRTCVSTTMPCGSPRSAATTFAVLRATPGSRRSSSNRSRHLARRSPRSASASCREATSPSGGRSRSRRSAQQYVFWTTFFRRRRPTGTVGLLPVVYLHRVWSTASAARAWPGTCSTSGTTAPGGTTSYGARTGARDRLAAGDVFAERVCDASNHRHRVQRRGWRSPARQSQRQRSDEPDHNHSGVAQCGGHPTCLRGEPATARRLPRHGWIHLRHLA